MVGRWCCCCFVMKAETLSERDLLEIEKLAVPLALLIQILKECQRKPNSQMQQMQTRTSKNSR